MECQFESQPPARLNAWLPANPPRAVLPPALPAAKENPQLVDALKNSTIFQEYGRAFTHMTGLPIFLIPAETALATDQMNQANLINELAHPLLEEPASLGKSPDDASSALTTLADRPPGMLAAYPYCTTIPININERVIGFLQTGLMLCQPPTASRFAHFIHQAHSQGITLEPETAKAAFFSAAVLTSQTRESAMKLLSFLAQHLGMLSHQFLQPSAALEFASIHRARTYIREHLSGKISLAQVAQAVNLNMYYFCKAFKRNTGQNFTAYVAQARIQKSKALLINNELSVANVASAAGFTSSTHFNRVFKKLTGLSPTAFRTQILTH